MARHAGTALAPRPVDAGDRRLVVVVDRTAAVPEWAVRWCRGSGRELVVHPLESVAAPAVLPAAERRGRAAVHAAAAQAAAEHAVAVAAQSAGEPGRYAGGPAGTAVLFPRAAPARRTPARVVAALRELPRDDGVLGCAVEAARHLDGELVLVHGVPRSFGERSIGLAGALDDGRAVLDAGTARAAGLDPARTLTTELVRAHPHELVGEELDADLLVLGGPRAGAFTELGLVARSALHHALCPVLLVSRPV